MNAKVEEIRDRLTADVVKSIEEKNPAWRKAWNLGPNAGNPTAASSGKTYRGGNHLVFSIVADMSGYSSKYWNTFQNWAKLGCFPRKGEKATWGVFADNKRVIDKYEPVDANGKDKYKTLFIYRAFCVFNAEQCHDAKDAGVLDKYLCKENAEVSKVSYDIVSELVKKHDIKLRHGGERAYYAPGPDFIQMPKKGFFTTAEDYYATLLHEMIHWAQFHSSDRKINGSKDDNEYADSELSAELGSMFLMRELGLPHGTAQQFESHAGYLKGWVSRMKQDNKYIFKVSSVAGRLVDYLLGKDASVEIKEEEEATV
jgi:antirestriction protein ArdC